MSRSNFYSKVLSLYKQLYKTRSIVFKDDKPTLQKSLNRLRNDFRINKEQTNETKIKELLKVGKDVDRLLKTSLYQTVKREDKENTFTLRIKPHMLLDNLQAPKTDAKTRSKKQ